MRSTTITHVSTEAVMEHKKVKLNGFTEKVQNGTVEIGEPIGKFAKDIGTDYSFKRKIVWTNAIGFLLLHFVALYGFHQMFYCHPYTILWFWALMYGSGQGITMGAHRFFAHKSFKATLIVRIGLVLLQTLSGQNCLYVWVRDHRQHHKFSDTDADPHNANRGFFFSHMGWLMSRKHPYVIAKGKSIDMSDLEACPIVMFQKKYYKSLYVLIAVAFPVAVPIYFWNETYINAFCCTYMFRYIVTLHFTWFVNSAAHFFGTKPYDKNMRPVESLFVSVVSTGEGWHNYHHAFPWDYRASEYGTKLNLTTICIDILAYFGLVYDLRAATDNMVQHRSLKAGDGSHPKYGPMKIEKDEELKTKQENHKINGITTTKQSKLIEETSTDSINDVLRKDLNIEDNHTEKSDTIIIKDSSTGETTTIKRNVKEKKLLHG